MRAARAKSSDCGEKSMAARATWPRATRYATNPASRALFGAATSILGILLGSAPAGASCDTIPMRVRYYPSVDASIDRPFGSPGDPVTVIRQKPNVFTGHERVTFVIGDATSQMSKTLECGTGTFTCTASAITASDSRLTFPVPKLLEGTTPVAGPTEITVTSNLGIVLATIRDLTVAAAPADQPSSASYASGKFTLLPDRTKILGTQAGNPCKQTPDLYAAIDANGNILIPLEKPEPSPPADSAILELGNWRRLTNTPDLPASVRAFTVEGRPLPPIVIGGADATVSGIAKAERPTVLWISAAALNPPPTATARYLAVDFDDGSMTEVQLNACSKEPVPLASYRTGTRIIAYPRNGSGNLLVGRLDSSAVCKCPKGLGGGFACINTPPPGSRPTLTAGENIAACLITSTNPPSTPLRITNGTGVQYNRADGFSPGELVDGSSVVIRRDRALGILSSGGLRSAVNGTAGGYRDYPGVTTASATVTRALAARGTSTNAQLIDLTTATGGEKDLGSPATRVALGDSAGAWTEPQSGITTTTALRLLDASQIQASVPAATKESIAGSVLQLGVWDRFAVVLIAPPDTGAATRLQVFDTAATTGTNPVVDCRAKSFVVGQPRDKSPAVVALVVEEGGGSNLCLRNGHANSANPGGGDLSSDGDTNDRVILALTTMGTDKPRLVETLQTIDTNVPSNYAWMAPYRAYGSVLHFLTNELQQDRDLDGNGSIENKLVQQLFDLNDPQGVSPNLTYPAPQLAGVQLVDVVDPAASDATLFAQEATDQTVLVAQQCTIRPPSAISSSSAGFQLLGDVDEDGALDSFDDCPDIRNPRQIDLDLDGLGDGTCDVDLCAAPARPISVSGFPAQLTAHAGQIANRLADYTHDRLAITDTCLTTLGVDSPAPLEGPRRSDRCRGSFVRDDEILPPHEPTAAALGPQGTATRKALEDIIGQALHAVGHPETQRKARALVRITAEATDAISRARHGEYETGVAVSASASTHEMDAAIIARRVRDVLGCCLSRAHDHGASSLDTCLDAQPGTTGRARPTSFFEWLGERFSCRLLQPRPVVPFSRPAMASNEERSTFDCVEDRQLAAICERSALTLVPMVPSEHLQCEEPDAGRSARPRGKAARAGS